MGTLTIFGTCTVENGECPHFLDWQGSCNHEVSMIEQPPKPDVPHPPDVIKHPPPVNTPVPPGEPETESRPDIHPVPPPTDPGPAAI